jgi:hypothetical protein
VAVKHDTAASATYGSSDVVANDSRVVASPQLPPRVSPLAQQEFSWSVVCYGSFNEYATFNNLASSSGRSSTETRNTFERWCIQNGKLLADDLMCIDMIAAATQRFCACPMTWRSDGLFENSKAAPQMV